MLLPLKQPLDEVKKCWNSRGRPQLATVESPTADVTAVSLDTDQLKINLGKEKLKELLMERKRKELKKTGKRSRKSNS